MPRHPRVHAEGLLYHVMARGNDGQKYESVKLSLDQLSVKPGLAQFDPVLRPREDYAATVSRCATFASRDIIAVALRCKIFSRASSLICASASALLVHSQSNSVPSVLHTMRSAPYKRTAASIAPGPNELQSTYTFARRKRDDGSS